MSSHNVSTLGSTLPREFEGCRKYLRILITFAVLVCDGSWRENKDMKTCVLGTATCTEQVNVVANPEDRRGQFEGTSVDVDII
ncbi:hypothetical protein VNO80_18360 [Phaseolus coccineus]|uniref:Uncharacterized protein n=1 Tax=Phaseolus coccineus TaxID=3886 RepID=A0AAN9MHK5_PHACN